MIKRTFSNKNKYLKNDYLCYRLCNHACLYNGLTYNTYLINLYFNKIPKNHGDIIDIMELYILDNVYNTLHFGYYIKKIDLKNDHASIFIDINTD